jgi:hypothetical protein
MNRKLSNNNIRKFVLNTQIMRLQFSAIFVCANKKSKMDMIKITSGNKINYDFLPLLAHQPALHSKNK